MVFNFIVSRPDSFDVWNNVYESYQSLIHSSIEHDMIVYSMSMPLWGVFVFSQDKKLRLPSSIGTAKKDLVHMIVSLWQLKVNQMILALYSLFKISVESLY